MDCDPEIGPEINVIVPRNVTLVILVQRISAIHLTKKTHLRFLLGDPGNKLLSRINLPFLGLIDHSLTGVI
jgi:hypothetical protein